LIGLPAIQVAPMLIHRHIPEFPQLSQGFGSRCVSNWTARGW